MEITRGLDILPRLNDTLMAFGSSRWSSLIAPVIPPIGVILAHLEGYDTRMVSTLGCLLGQGELESSTSELAQRQTTLPIPRGGGACSFSHIRPRAYLGSITLSAPALTTHFLQRSEVLGKGCKRVGWDWG